MTAAGFEPAPFRTAALTLRLRPLGHAVDAMQQCTLGYIRIAPHPENVVLNL